MDVKAFKKLPLLGILRNVNADIIEPLTETIISSGLKTVEIAMNTPQAPSLIKHMVKIAKNRLTVGAGTVLSTNSLQKALDSGATFIVLPTLMDKVVQYCVKRRIPVFPGALTPQEIYNAWSCGATMVKVFPAKMFGPSYLKEIKGPFQDIELLACGGVTPDNIQAFFTSGASAIAFGGSIFKKEHLASRKFSRIEESIKMLIESFKKINNQTK